MEVTSWSPRGIVPVSKNVVQMMQTRLEEVEDSATQLTKEILTARQQGSTDRFSLLLSKTQSMESVLQSLKLNFVNLSTLTRQPSDLEQKLVEMTDIYTEEMKKLSAENAHLKTDKQELNEQRQHMELELQKARLSLEEASLSQHEKEDAIVAERNRGDSLLKKVAELDRQLSEERHLRFALDRANSELGQRLDEIESLLKQEQIENQNFTSDFIKLKKDFSKKCDELKHEKSNKKQIEMEMVTVCQELETRMSELEVMKKEKTKVSSDISTVHEKYAELNQQLEAMQSLFGEYQKDKAEAEAECAKLNAKIDELNADNTRLTEELIRAQANDETARLIDVRQQLRHMTKQRDEAISDNEILTQRVEELEASCQEMEKELNELKENADKEAESKFAMIGGLQDRLASLKSELMSLEGEKENILTEVNGAVDAMDGERSELQAEIESYKQKLAAAVDDLEEEKSRSKELEQEMQTLNSKTSFTHFDRHLAELTSQKNTLSYENGKLQSEVEQLQGELTSVKANHRDVEKVQKNLKQAETKIRKLKQELSNSRQALTQAEMMSQQLQTTSELRETDFNSAIRARDEALKDAKILASRVESLEEAIQQQEELKTEVEEKLREDNSKVAESLENMMALHTELQCKYETVQIELGKRDSQMNELKKERKRLQDKLVKVEGQFDSVSDKFSELESKQSCQTKNIEREIKSVKMDNSKLVRTLQDTLELNEQLRAQVSLLEETLCKQRAENDKLSSKSKEVESKMKQQESSYLTKISDLESQIGKERDKAYQRMEDQLRTVQMETENILERNSSLLQQNSSLKTEVSGLSQKNETLQEKVDGLQQELSDVEQKLKQKAKQASKLKSTEDDANKLRQKTQELSAQCKSQEKTIHKFVTQFKEVQKEMKQLVTLHNEQTEVLTEKDRLLQAEELKNEELRSKFHESKKQISALQALQKATETRLMEANNDTQIATETLEDTNRYFKERFSALASELSTARRVQKDVEWRNLEQHHLLTQERMRVEDTAAKARNMIKESRHHLMDITDKTEFDISLRDDAVKQLSSTTMSPLSRSTGISKAKPDVDLSIEDILSVSQQQNTTLRSSHLKDRHSATSASPFTSSSQKLDAIINEMERRRLIS